MAGTDWLFSVDDDELLHLTSGKFVKVRCEGRRTRASTFYLRLDNPEVSPLFLRSKRPTTS